MVKLSESDRLILRAIDRAQGIEGRGLTLEALRGRVPTLPFATLSMRSAKLVGAGLLTRQPAVQGALMEYTLTDAGRHAL